MVEWSQAFDRHTYTLGIKSFIENGVRPSLISILMTFFQNREITVKWKGILSKVRALPCAREIKMYTCFKVTIMLPCWIQMRNSSSSLGDNN